MKVDVIGCAMPTLTFNGGKFLASYDEKTLAALDAIESLRQQAIALLTNVQICECGETDAEVCRGDSNLRPPYCRISAESNAHTNFGAALPSDC